MPAKRLRGFETGRVGPKDGSEFIGGNYLSANFDDDYWNTPEGIEEAIGIWGRPIGNKIGNTGLFN